MIKKSFKSFAKLLIPKKLHSKVYYFGNRYECPLCKSHFRKFVPWGLKFTVLTDKKVVGSGNINGRCPVCNCHDRARLVYLYLSHKTDILNRSQKLLHVAPEPQVAKILREKLGTNYVAADLNPKDFMVKMDLTNIQYPDNSFDAIICCHVLEHIVDDRKAMSELYRVLKPGGWAILQVPISLTLGNTYEDFSITSPAARAEAFGQEDHVRIYAKDYTNRLEQAGFKVKTYHWNNEDGAFNNLKNKFGLNEQEDVYLASKIP